MGYIRSTHCAAIKVETLCPPLNIRCRWLAGKFILKSLSTSNHLIFDTFYSLIFLWQYVKKSFPVLLLTANSILSFLPYILNTLKLSRYEFSNESALYSPLFS